MQHDMGLERDTRSPAWLIKITQCVGAICGVSARAAVLAVYLDFSHKSKLLDSAACKQRYPELDNIIQQQEAASKADAAPHSSVIHLWADMARTMVMAHQRRGESDLVAHWLYQLLALDTTAEEWGHAMQR